MQTFFRFACLVVVLLYVTTGAMAEENAALNLGDAVQVMRGAVEAIQADLPDNGVVAQIMTQLDQIEQLKSEDNAMSALFIINENLVRLARKTEAFDEMLEDIRYAYSARIRSLEARASVLDGRVDGLKDQTDALEHRTDDLEAISTTHAQSLGGLESRVGLLEGRQGRMWFMMATGGGYVWNGGVIVAGAGLAYERGQFYADVLSSFQARPGHKEFDIRIGSRMGFMLPQAESRVTLGVSPEIGLSSDAVFRLGLGGFVKMTLWRNQSTSGRVDAAFDLGAALGVVFTTGQANDDPTKLGFAEGFATLRIGSRAPR